VHPILFRLGGVVIMDEVMERQEMEKLFAETANIHTPEGMAAYRAFAAALTTPILQKIELESIMRKLFTVERLAPGAQAVYPVEIITKNDSSFIQQCILKNHVNSRKPLTDNAEGNLEPSLEKGRCRDYPVREYAVSTVEAHGSL